MTTHTLPENVIEVNIDVEGGLSEFNAFNTVAFFTVSDSSQRNIKVNSLSEVVSAGFSKGSSAYNFCLGVFNQKKMSQVVIRSVRTNESYLDAYKSFSNNSYYFIVIENKDIDVVLNFRQSLEDSSQNKLLFFSTGEDVSEKVGGLSRLVYYFDESLSDETFILLFDGGDYVTLDDSGNIALEEE